jgi:hypothetical protein
VNQDDISENEDDSSVRVRVRPPDFQSEALTCRVLKFTTVQEHCSSITVTSYAPWRQVLLSRVHSVVRMYVVHSPYQRMPTYHFLKYTCV